MLARPITPGAAALSEAVQQLYAEGQSDYSLEPLVLVDEHGCPIGRIQDRDAVVFCCRRGEREVQLTEAFTDPAFERFTRGSFAAPEFVILTLYHEKFKHLPVAFAPSRIQDTLAEAISRAGLRQAHIAESEKFAHVTFFFNGGNNQPFEGEQDIKIPSPHGVALDQVPELSLAQVAEATQDALQQRFDFVVVNFANGDVIGHTSNEAAKIQCASFVDRRLGQVLDSALAADYVVLITADHGNLELMKNADGTPHVAHTTNPVPFVMIDARSRAVDCARDGALSDIAPTVLSALAVDIPAPMGKSTLTPGHAWGGRRRVLLVILDGWGIGRQDESNPIHVGSTPRWDALLRRHAHSRLQAAGEAAGLEPGKPGNSEAGHMNIGAGRTVAQDDVRLDRAMQDGSFESNEVLLKAIRDAKQRDGSLQLIGLLSENSSHGSIEYPLAMLRMAKTAGLKRVYLHVIFDGRSTQPGSAPALLQKLEADMQKIGLGEIVTGMGRAVALDRDGNYEKTRLAFDALVSGQGRRVNAR